MKHGLSLFSGCWNQSWSGSFLAVLLAGIQVQRALGGAVTSLAIGGFSASRSGDVSVPSGSYFTQLRAALLTNFTNVSFVSLSELTQSNLAGVDLLILAPSSTVTGSATPLSTNEQHAALDFVSQGGGILLLTDNYNYAATAPDEENALLNPFGMSGSGTIYGAVYAPVISPASHPVTSGPFGTVTSFSQIYPGGITNLGPYAVGLATNTLGWALAVIPDGVLARGSGRVAIFSDYNSFVDDGGYGAFSANESLFLNTVTWTRRTNWNPRLNLQRSSGQVVLSWPEASGFALESSPSLAAGASWQPVQPDPVVLGTLNVVTNGMTNAVQFYRLRGQ